MEDGSLRRGKRKKTLTFKAVGGNLTPASEEVVVTASIQNDNTVTPKDVDILDVEYEPSSERRKLTKTGVFATKHDALHRSAVQKNEFEDRPNHPTREGVRQLRAMYDIDRKAFVTNVNEQVLHACDCIRSGGTDMRRALQLVWDGIGGSQTTLKPTALQEGYIFPTSIAEDEANSWWLGLCPKGKCCIQLAGSHDHGANFSTSAFRLLAGRKSYCTNANAFQCISWDERCLEIWAHRNKEVRIWSTLLNAIIVELSIAGGAVFSKQAGSIVKDLSITELMQELHENLSGLELPHVSSLVTEMESANLPHLTLLKQTKSRHVKISSLCLHMWIDWRSHAGLEPLSVNDFNEGMRSQGFLLALVDDIGTHAYPSDVKLEDVPKAVVEFGASLATSLNLNTQEAEGLLRYLKSEVPAEVLASANMERDGVMSRTYHELQESGGERVVFCPQPPLRKQGVSVLSTWSPLKAQGQAFGYMPPAQGKIEPQVSLTFAICGPAGGMATQSEPLACDNSNYQVFSEGLDRVAGEAALGDVIFCQDGLGDTTGGHSGPSKLVFTRCVQAYGELLFRSPKFIAAQRLIMINGGELSKALIPLAKECSNVIEISRPCRILGVCVSGGDYNNGCSESGHFLVCGSKKSEGYILSLGARQPSAALFANQDGSISGVPSCVETAHVLGWTWRDVNVFRALQGFAPLDLAKTVWQEIAFHERGMSGWSKLAIGYAGPLGADPSVGSFERVAALKGDLQRMEVDENACDGDISALKAKLKVGVERLEGRQESGRFGLTLEESQEADRIIARVDRKELSVAALTPEERRLYETRLKKWATSSVNAGISNAVYNGVAGAGMKADGSGEKKSCSERASIGYVEPGTERLVPFRERRANPHKQYERIDNAAPLKARKKHDTSVRVREARMNGKDPVQEGIVRNEAALVRMNNFGRGRYNPNKPSQQLTCGWYRIPDIPGPVSRSPEVAASSEEFSSGPTSALTPGLVSAPPTTDPTVPPTLVGTTPDFVGSAASSASLSSRTLADVETAGEQSEHVIDVPTTARSSIPVPFRGRPPVVATGPRRICTPVPCGGRPLVVARGPRALSVGVLETAERGAPLGASTVASARGTTAYFESQSMSSGTSPPHVMSALPAKSGLPVEYGGPTRGLLNMPSGGVVTYPWAPWMMEIYMQQQSTYAMKNQDQSTVSKVQDTGTRMRERQSSSP